MSTAEDTLAQPTGDPIVDEANRRFKRACEWEAEFQIRFTEDLKFRHGDDDNGWQWPNTLRFSRNSDQRPCLTINNIAQHVLMVVNGGKQVREGVNVVATGNGATKESADVMEAIVESIEYASQAQLAYSIGQEFQVAGGIGYWRIVTDYAGPDSMDLDIFIRPINDPTSVLLDPDIRMRNGSDARWGIIFDNIPKAEFEEAYPELKEYAGIAPLGPGTGVNDMLSSSHVRVAEYFRKVLTPDKLLSYRHEGKRKTIRKSQISDDHFQALISDPYTRWRHVQDEKIEWYLIVGEHIVDETEWAGKYIPIIRCPGEEVVVEGLLDRKGLTRAMKGAQRMYNYNASAQVEHVALQNKIPWVAPADAIENYEVYWNTANITNHSILPYNHKDEQGQAIPPPQRTQPPASSEAYKSGMDTAFQQMMMTTGQWQNQMGMGGNERTGKAIQERQGQSDIATFHFVDNYRMALIFTGIQLIDLIPKIYDTQRAIKIQAEDGSDQEVEIDPLARKAFLQQQAHNGEVVKRIFNPSLGLYDVRAKAGLSYGTRREQTVDSLTLLLTQAPSLTPIVGDLLLSAMDFKEAQEASQRLRRLVPPAALGQGPTPQEQKMSATITQLQDLLKKALDKSAKDSIKIAGKDELRDIEVFDAETKRLSALQKQLPLDQEGLRQFIVQTIGEAAGVNLSGVLAANQSTLQPEASPSA